MGLLIWLLFSGMFIFLKSKIATNSLREKNKEKFSIIESIEEVIQKYENRINKTTIKKQELINISEKIIRLLKFYFFKDNLHLYLLRTHLYRILNKSILDPNLRKLVKSEILKAPKGTFSEFVKLYYELKGEL